jgi:uncharacterized protein YggE
MENPDTITVQSICQEELRAHKAEIRVTVLASALFTTDSALKKVKEVSGLVASLLELGIKDEHIQLLHVYPRGATGPLGRGTSSNYTIRINCPDLELLSNILEVVTGQKYITFDELIWHYPDDQTAQGAWLDRCLTGARQKGERMAEALGVKLLGVHSMTHEWIDVEQPERYVISAPVDEKRARTASLLTTLGFPLVTSRTVTLKVTVQFRVSSYA